MSTYKKYTCQICNYGFESNKGCATRTPKFCSKKCFGASLKLYIKCKQCEKTIENKHSVSIRNRIYCSKECKSFARKGMQLSEEWKKALSEGRKNSPKCRGENLYNWKGGKSTIKIRMKEHQMKRKRSLVKDLPIEFLKYLLILQKNLCFYCDNSLKHYKAIEHLTPVTRGGDNDVYNIVYSCKTCNSKKRQQTLEEYALKTQKYYLINKWENLFFITINKTTTNGKICKN